jgi:hypothetical protein
MKKKIVLGLTAMVLVAAMAIGGTLAFMTAKTADVTNHFHAAAGLTGEIREPAWDGFTFTDQQSTGLIAKSGLTPTVIAGLGLTKAAAFTPGLVIPKDPTLKNTTTATPEYMAIKVTYKNAATKAQFNQTNSLASFTLNAGWVVYDDTDATSTTYVYGAYNAADVSAANPKGITLTTVAGNTPTATALFSNITINPNKTADIQNLDFNLVITGSAVQTSDITQKAAYEALAAKLTGTVAD